MVLVSKCPVVSWKIQINVGIQAYIKETFLLLKFGMQLSHSISGMCVTFLRLTLCVCVCGAQWRGRESIAGSSSFLPPSFNAYVGVLCRYYYILYCRQENGHTCVGWRERIQVASSLPRSLACLLFVFRSVSVRREKVQLVDRRDPTSITWGLIRMFLCRTRYVWRTVLFCVGDLDARKCWCRIHSRIILCRCHDHLKLGT